VEWQSADPETIADRLAHVLGREGAILALPGGRTPIPVYEALAGRGRADGTIWPTDDRIVAHDHPASNYGTLRRSLAGMNVVALHEGARVPHFDLVWIGMGADGHVASIFPNALDGLVTGRDVVRTRPDPLPPEAPFDRLTLTMDSLVDTNEAMLVITGADKRRVFEAALAGDDRLPISRFVAKLSAPLTVYWSAQ